MHQSQVCICRCCIPNASQVILNLKILLSGKSKNEECLNVENVRTYVRMYIRICTCVITKLSDTYAFPVLHAQWTFKIPVPTGNMDKL